MNELLTYKSPIDIEAKNCDFGILTTFKNANGIGIGKQINNETQTVLAARAYKADQTYDNIYFIISADGNVINVLQETEGILPEFFKSPEDKLFISLIPYDPDKEMEISIPFFEREKAELPKANKPFVGDFAGATGNSSFFISSDIFAKTKPDRWLNIEFKNGIIKKKNGFKIELPSKNKVYISNGEIHLLGRVVSTLTHRRIDANAKTIEQRDLTLSNYGPSQIISLSFGQSSNIIIARNEKIFLVTIDSNNEISELELLKMEQKIFGLFEAVKLSEGVLLFRFTHETGNGWFVIRENKVVECFIQNKEHGYRNIITNEFIELGYNNLILSGANKTNDNCYALSIYPQAENGKISNVAFILNRKVR